MCNTVCVCGTQSEPVRQSVPEWHRVCLYNTERLCVTQRVCNSTFVALNILYDNLLRQTARHHSIIKKKNTYNDNNYNYMRSQDINVFFFFYIPSLHYLFPSKYTTIVLFRNTCFMILVPSFFLYFILIVGILYFISFL